MAAYESVSQWFRTCSSSVIKDRLDPECISWTKSRIDSCLTTHPHRTSHEKFCPKRLIDVRSEPIRLALRQDVDQDGLAASPCYAALSYCWGTQAESNCQLKTTNKSLPEMLSAIDFHQLPSAIQDAVLTTRSLSIPFLWVDALCIIQDNRRDWEQQSAEMDRVYRNAYLTIASPASNFCNEGFRYASDDKVYIDFHSTVNPTIKGLFSIRLLGGTTRSRDSLSDVDIIFSSIEDSAWSSRGWTYQELFMSNRLLFFGRSELLFMCSTSHYMSLPAELAGFYWIHHDGDWTQHNAQEAYDDWQHLVICYSARCGGFTRNSDILPAFSGIAAHFQKTVCLQQDDYVAGLWRDDLWRSAAWNMCGINTRWHTTLSARLQALGSTADYIAPSWSWVNCGSVEFVAHDSSTKPARSECTIDVWTTAKGENRLGEILTAGLRITGKVFPLPSDLERQKLDHTYRDFCPWVPQTIREGEHRWRIYLDWSPESDSQAREELKMVVTGSYNKGEGMPREYFGLLVHEAGGIHRGKYFRVGVFQSEPNVWRPQSSEKGFLQHVETQTLEII